MILGVYALHITVCVILSLEFWPFHKSGFYVLSFWHNFWIYYLFSLPLATGIAVVVDSVLEFLSKTRRSIGWGIFCDVLGILIFAVYVIFFVRDSGIETFDMWATSLLTIVVWFFWIVRSIACVMLNKRQKKQKHKRNSRQRPSA